MDLNYLQKKFKKYGDKAAADSKKLNVKLPNNYAFPFLKLVEEVGEVADLLADKYGIRAEMSDEEFKEKLGGGIK